MVSHYSTRSAIAYHWNVQIQRADVSFFSVITWIIGCHFWDVCGVAMDIWTIGVEKGKYMKDSDFKSLRLSVWKLQTPLKSWIMTRRPRWQLMHWGDAFPFTCKGEREHSTVAPKKASNSCWLKRPQALTHLVTLRRGATLQKGHWRDCLPSWNLCRRGSFSQPHLRSGESLWLVEVNTPGVAQQSPAQDMHIKADNAYKCK